MSKKTILVIDCVYDFIDGSLACIHAEEAVKYIVAYINAHPENQVAYVREVHPANHCSFVEQGGVWPPHAVEGTRGALLHEDFYTKIEKTDNRPNDTNVFVKGQNPEVEQYSGYESISRQGKKLRDVLEKEIIVMGIATEYCVFNTVNDLVEERYKIQVEEEGLGYVTLVGHEETLARLKKRR